MASGPRSGPIRFPARPNILFFGRLEPYKGLRVLMDAMPLVWEVRPDAELVVAGSGQAESEVTDDDPRIRKLARYVPEAEVSQLFRDAQLSWPPTRRAARAASSRSRVRAASQRS